MLSTEPTVSSATFLDVPVDWEALEDAFENNAPDVHSYLHVVTGDVIRFVGLPDPDAYTKVRNDPNCQRVPPISSRDQYVWMQAFTDALPASQIRVELRDAIADGKGAFRRFKNVVMRSPESIRWLTFRTEKIRNAAETWLARHSLNPVPRTKEPTSLPARVAAILLDMTADDLVKTLTIVVGQRCIACGDARPCSRHTRKSAKTVGAEA